MSDFDVENLIKQIKELEAELQTAKKYGLVWDKENTKEDVVLMCEKFIPVLDMVKALSVEKGKNNNILIEGDNYHSLSSLNFVKKESIDFIYIDPPYNTGHEDFSYNDKIVNEDDSYRHSKWLSLMQKRLLLARELLTKEGVIFISIDDIEVANLTLLCNSIFGEKNHLATMIWKSKSGGANDSANIATDHEYVLAYSKNYYFAKIYNDLGAVVTTSYNQKDEKGRYALDRLDKQSLGYHESLDFPIIGPDGKEYRVIHKNPNKKQARWRWGADTVKERYSELVFKWPYVYTKNYEKKTGQTPRTILFEDRFGRTRTGSTDLRDVIGVQNIFTYPKPVSLLKYLVSIGCKKDGVVLDFFAGSGTTGQAVLELNKEDGGERRFILCTNNENDICKSVTYPRLKTVITGTRPDGTKYSDGISSNLYYFKTNFIKDELNTEQAKYNLVEKVDALLCIAENIFDEKERNDYSSHFSSGSRHLFIYNDYYNADKFNEFKNRVLSANGEKIVYVYSSDNSIDETLIENSEVTIKPIPSKIYEIYKEIVEEIKRGE